MTVLNINGRRITVDDSFKNLSPEQQNATVDEISKSIGGQAPVKDETPVGQAPAADGNLRDAGVTWLENTISGIPIAGPAIQGASDFIGSNIQGLVTGEDPSQIRADLNARREARNQAYPASALSGQIAGNVATLGGVGVTAAGAEALGITGAKLLPRALNSAKSSALISSADTAARGGDGFEAAESGVISGAIGGAIPIVGAGLSAAARAIGDRIAPTINAVLSPAEEASRRVGVAAARDRAAGNVVNPADEAIAKATGVDLLNADRGGETVRALARSVANQSPEARQVLVKTADDRFAQQGQRATDVVRRLAGGAADDLAYQEAITKAAAAANRPAYARAFSDPKAQQVYTPRLQELMQSPSMRRAVSTVPKRSADRGAVDGFKEIPNPFSQNSQGAFVLTRKADGTMVAPTLQFWDQVKRNLDSQIGKAKRAGDNALTSDLMAIKNAMVDELDTAVPSYRNARRGAAAFFDAEDSVEAGKKFANTPRLVPEAKKAFEKFSDAEKAGFMTGYASELIDRIKVSGDRTNVINSMFKNQSSRESVEMVFGPRKAKALEAYVRVEDLADRLRGAMGNSTTARQLVELGLGAGSGYALSGGDMTGAVLGGLAVRGGRALQGQAESKVMQIVANMLTSGDPKMIESAIKHAEKSPAFMQAIERLGTALAAPVRGVANAGVQ